MAGPWAGSAPRLTTLPHDLLVAVLALLTQAERQGTAPSLTGHSPLCRQRTAQVCKRLRHACDAPELAHVVRFDNGGSTAQLREVAAVRLPSLRAWCVRHAAHVRFLTLNWGGPRARAASSDRAQADMLAVACLEACAAAGQLLQLAATTFAQHFHLHALLSLPRLTSLYLCNPVGTVNFWPGTQRLTNLRRLCLECPNIVFEPGAALPPSLTCVSFGAGVAPADPPDAVAEQVR